MARGRERGFTLIELMIAIAMFSSLLLIAMPRFTDFQESMTMKATARNLATNFRLAQQRASAANRPCYMDFDLTESFLTIWLDTDLDETFDGLEEVRAVGFVQTDQNGSVPGVLLPANTIFESTTFSAGTRGFPSVAFASDGSVAEAGEVVVRDDGGRRYRISVTLPGAIVIAQDIGGSWVE
ncbi:MAG: GspH/FimT family pseudopilin [Gemmatimonadota bacterium]